MHSFVSEHERIPMCSTPLFLPLHARIIIGDTETTGLAPWGCRDGVATNDPEGPDRLCSAAFVKMQRTMSGWTRVSELSFLVDPERSIPEEAARVNGFTRSETPHVEEGINLFGVGTFRAVAEQLLRFIGDIPLCFHNAVFDSSVLDAEFARAGFPMLGNTLFCTKKAFSDIRGLGRPHEYVSGTNLNALCDMLRVSRDARVGPDGTELHGAAIDRDMAAACMIELDRRGWMKPEVSDTMPHRNQ